MMVHPHAEALVVVLRAGRYRTSTEAALQDSIEQHLTSSGVEFEREKVLAPGERIDFFAGGVGIEAKARANKRAVFRQLERYATNDAIDALILITGTAMGLPATVKGKALFYVSIGRSAL